MSDSKINVMEGLQAAFCEVVPSADHILQRDDDLIDLGISSIAAIEMAAALGARYGIHLPEESLAELRTIGDFADLLEQLVSAKDAD